MQEQKIQLVTCTVLLNGDRNSTTVYDDFNPVTAPEAYLLAYVHGGEHAVLDVKPAKGARRHVVRTLKEERQRLFDKYGDMTMQVYPGKFAPMNMPDRIEGTEIEPNEDDEQVELPLEPTGDEPIPRPKRKALAG